MQQDTINDEILAIKRRLAAQFDNDLDRIVADLQAKQRNTVCLPPRSTKSEPNDTPQSPVDGLPDGASTSAAE